MYLFMANQEICGRSILRLDFNPKTFNLPGTPTTSASSKLLKMQRKSGPLLVSGAPVAQSRPEARADVAASGLLACCFVAGCSFQIRKAAKTNIHQIPSATIR